MNSEFRRGWIAATGHTEVEADQQWAGYSRQLNDSERDTLERDGFSSGFAMGAEWNGMFSARLEVEAEGWR